MALKEILTTAFERCMYIGLALALTAWAIIAMVVFKMYSASRVGKMKCDECGSEYFEMDTVGYHVSQAFLEPGNGRDWLKFSIVLLILALGVCSLGLLFNVLGALRQFKDALNDKNWKIIIGFGIIFYRVLVLSITLLWAYGKKDELTPFSDYSDLEGTKKTPALTNKIIFNQFMITTTIISLAMFILTFFSILDSNPLVFVGYLFVQYIVNMILPVVTRYGVDLDNLVRIDYQDSTNVINDIIRKLYTNPKTTKLIKEYFYKNVNRARKNRSDIIPQTVIDRMQNNQELYKFVEHGIFRWNKK